MRTNTPPARCTLQPHAKKKEKQPQSRNCLGRNPRVADCNRILHGGIERDAHDIIIESVNDLWLVTDQLSGFPIQTCFVVLALLWSNTFGAYTETHRVQNVYIHYSF